MCKVVQLESLHTGASLDRRTRPGRAVVGRDVLHIFHSVHPDAEGAGAGGLAQEIVTSILDHKANAVVPREVDRKLDLGDTRGVDSVRWISTLCATFRVEQRRRLASQANLVRAHDFDRVIASGWLLEGSHAHRKQRYIHESCCVPVLCQSFTCSLVHAVSPICVAHLRHGRGLDQTTERD